MSKVLQHYKDWLIFDRGKIEPKVGDKIKLIRNDSWCERIVKEVFGTEFNIQLQFSDYRYDWEYLTKCYVEIDYNPNEAIEFQKYLDKWYPISHLYEAENKTLEQLYKEFKNGI